MKVLVQESLSKARSKGEKAALLVLRTSTIEQQRHSKVRVLHAWKVQLISKVFVRTSVFIVKSRVKF